MPSQPSTWTNEPETWAPICHCGEPIIPGTDLDGRLVEFCVLGHQSETTTQRRRK